MSRRKTYGARLLARTPEPVLPVDLPQPEAVLPQAPATEPPPAPPERPARIVAEVAFEGGEWRLIPRSPWDE